MNYQYFREPLKVNEGDATYCPYVKIPNPFINSPIETPRDMNGNKFKELCVPNLSNRKTPNGYGMNNCKNNKPVHLNFNIKSNCYSDNTCQTEMKTCYDPYM